MNRKQTLLLSLVALIIATLACSAPGATGQAGDLTATFAAALTQAFGTAQTKPSGTPVAIVTLPGNVTPTLPVIVSATSALTATPTPIPSATACANNAKFVTDVTIPDGTVFNTPTAFTKTWRIQNTGTCPWDSTYTLRYVSGAQLDGPNSVAFSGAVAPGGTLDISVNLRSPAAAGTYISRWRLTNAAGNGFGTNNQPITVVIVVPGTPTPTNTPTATATNTPVTPTATFTNTSTNTPTATTTPLGSAAGDYAGNWYNNDPATSGVTQLVISANSSNQVTVTGWGWCGLTDCAWGNGTGNVVGNSVTVANFSSASGVTLVLSIPVPGILRANYNAFTYDFHIGPVANDWVGTWTNTNSSTINVTRIIITSVGGQLTLHPFYKCTPTNCDWGTQTFPYANPLVTSGFPHALVVTFIRANEMRVQDTSLGLTEDFRR